MVLLNSRLQIFKQIGWILDFDLYFHRKIWKIENYQSKGENTAIPIWSHYCHLCYPGPSKLQYFPYLCVFLFAYAGFTLYQSQMKLLICKTV